MMKNQSNALVSVIITTFHNEIYLPRAIESIRNQSYPNIELIVVDDNPPESDARKKTEAVMENYPDVIYLRHTENKNGAAARNTGIRFAKGKYIAFLDNDDIYFREHIASCVEAAQSHPDCKCILCGVVKIQEGICWDIIPAITKDPVKTLFFQETALGTGSNLFVEADAVREIDGFDERFRRHQDVEFGLRLFSRHPVYGLDDVQIIKEMAGFSNVPNFERFLETKQFLWKTFADEIGKLTADEQNRYYAGQYGSLLYTACRSGKKESIDWTIKQLKKYRPLNKKEHLLVLLCRLHLFQMYETLKRLVKQNKSPALYDRVAQHLSEYDLDVFQKALSADTKEANR